MSITAKELARLLNISPAAVSMALNGKPGVSTDTKRKVFEAAEKYGYDFTKLSSNQKEFLIYVITYHVHNAIISYSPIFDDMIDGIKQICDEHSYKFKLIDFYEKNDNIERLFEDIRGSDCSGIIILATEMQSDACRSFLTLKVPIVFLDTCFNNMDCNCVSINNFQGAYKATDYLISRSGKQPGHLRSSYPIYNFNERNRGFESAIRENGMSCSRSITHMLAPSIDGAFSDMLNILNENIPLADCYFADNDLIAIGAMKALKSQGFHIPEDIMIAGFDSILEGRIVEPALTSIVASRRYMALVAINTLIFSITNPMPHYSQIQVSTSLVKRFST